MGKDFEDFWGGEMTVAADQEMRGRPVAPELGQQAHQAPRILRPRRALPRAEEGGH